VTNTFVLHQGWSPRPRLHSAVKTIKTFCLQLAHELTGEYCSCHHGGRVGSSLVPLPLQHYPVKIPPANPTRGSGSTVTVSVTSELTLSGFAGSVMCGCVTLDMRRVLTRACLLLIP